MNYGYRLKGDEPSKDSARSIICKIMAIYAGFECDQISDFGPAALEYWTLNNPILIRDGLTVIIENDCKFDQSGIDVILNMFHIRMYGEKGERYYLVLENKRYYSLLEAFNFRLNNRKTIIHQKNQYIVT